MFRFSKILLLQFVLGLTLAPLGFAATAVQPKTNNSTPAAVIEDYAALMEKANAFYDQRDQTGAIEKAIAYYKKALAQNPEDYESLWRLSRSYWWQGDHAPKSKKADIFEAGKSAAERAQKAAPDKTEGYYWFGVNLGRASEVRGIMNSLFSVDTLRKSQEKVLEIDPEDGFAHHVLGVLYRKAPGWPLACGDSKKSLHHAQKAVQYAPEDILPRIGLAEILKVKGRKDEARKLLEEALLLPGPADKQPETKKDKKKAEELLEKFN